MVLAPPPWQLALARLEGALPFLSAQVADGLALASLRRLWRVHVRDFPQENQGPEHNPGLEAAELARSWYTAERLSAAKIDVIDAFRDRVRVP